MTRTILAILVSTLSSIPSAACVIGDLGDLPEITITASPPDCCDGQWAGTVSGFVNNVDTDSVVVVLYVLTNTYYVQPFIHDPLTEIDCPDGSFENETRGGCRYCAILAKRSWQPPATLFEIPPVGGEVLAFDCSVDSERTGLLEFAGRRWIVKTCCGDSCGPGPNLFSDSPENLWVDSEEQLHLRITEQDGNWSCAEIATDHYLGYGLYQYEVVSNIDALDPSVVFSGFNYSDRYLTDHDEIDIEFSRWGIPTAPNAQFVVQPHETCLRERFFMDLTGVKSMHEFLWSGPGSIRFATREGGLDDIGHDIATYTYSTTDPGCVQVADAERMRFNLWLSGGTPPTDGQEVEVVVSAFRFYEFPSGIAEGGDRGLRLFLGQPSPNPSNAGISYWIRLVEPAHARVVLYDGSGRFVKEQLDRDLPAGMHHDAWVPREAPASGVYYLRLEAFGSTETRKFVVIR